MSRQLTPQMNDYRVVPVFWRGHTEPGLQTGWHFIEGHYLMQVYVLSNCDTCRKALKWLRDNDIAFESLDIRKSGIGREVVEAAIGELGWQKVLNRRSTSWRNLDDDMREGLDDDKAADLIGANVTLMKRPLFVFNGRYLAGFDDGVRTIVSGLNPTI